MMPDRFDGGLCEHIRWMAVEFLGERVSLVDVAQRDHGFLTGVGVTTSSGRRHAVTITDMQIADLGPVGATRAACARIVEWLDAKGAADG